MKRSLLCTSLVCVSALVAGQAAAAINTNYRVNASTNAAVKSSQWIPASALKQDNNGDSFLSMRVYKDGNVQTYRGYLAKNGRKGYAVIMRDEHDLQPLAVEGIARVTTADQLRRQGFNLSASNKYGSAKPGEQLIEISWFKQPQYLRRPSQG